MLLSQHLGQVSAIDLTFHNAYGPDKPWFYDKTLSGGGCVIDLGVHLIDLALWALEFPKVVSVTSNLLAQGRPLSSAPGRVEDYALATLVLATGAVVRLACSWRLNAGQDCIINASFYGTAGGAAVHNVGWSFYDHAAERFSGTATERIAEGPDDWGGRAANARVGQLAVSRKFDPEAEHLVRVADVIDQIYASAYGAVNAGTHKNEVSSLNWGTCQPSPQFLTAMYIEANMPKRRFHREKAPTARPTDLVIRSSLPQWVVRVLRQSGIKRMSVIAALSDQQLLELPGIGRRALELIRNEIGQMPEVTRQSTDR